MFEVHDVVGNLQHVRHSSGIVHCAQAAAAAVLLLCGIVLILPDLHGDSNDIISLFLQQIGRH